MENRNECRQKNSGAFAPVQAEPAGCCQRHRKKLARCAGSSFVITLFLRYGRPARKNQGKAGCIGIAADPDTAAVQLCNGADDCQAQATGISGHKKPRCVPNGLSTIHGQWRISVESTVKSAPSSWNEDASEWPVAVCTVRPYPTRTGHSSQLKRLSKTPRQNLPNSNLLAEFACSIVVGLKLTTCHDAHKNPSNGIERPVFGIW